MVSASVSRRLSPERSVISFSTARPLGARHRNMKSIDLEEIGHLRADNEDTRDPEHRFGGAQRRRQAVT
jgi:hypothetical protein